MLISQGPRPKGSVTFRWHSWGCPIVAPKRGPALYEERRRPTGPQTMVTYLVKLSPEETDRAIGELVLAGYAEDPRSPKWLTEAMAAVASRLTAA